ncbi:MAG: hypothetical protein LBK99_13620 [Opitutaceae bacterium]|jgi:hypothetical protein|nr:hypothetical protein [Opitutaceae bacterium]
MIRPITLLILSATTLFAATPTALYQGATDAQLTESIVAALLDRLRLLQSEEIATLTPIPLIPPAMPDITII